MLRGDRRMPRHPPQRSTATGATTPARPCSQQRRRGLSPLQRLPSQAVEPAAAAAAGAGRRGATRRWGALSPLEHDPGAAAAARAHLELDLHRKPLRHAHGVGNSDTRILQPQRGRAQLGHIKQGVGCGTNAPPDQAPRSIRHPARRRRTNAVLAQGATAIRRH